MSDRTDLFKTLNNFMAVLAAYAPGSHREGLVLEVGDTAFRAFERAAAPYPPDGTSRTGAYELACHTQSGRVVIRKRQPSRDEREAQLEREKADTYENVPAPPGTMPKTMTCDAVGLHASHNPADYPVRPEVVAYGLPPVPTLSPRQALGEALACVARARDLLRTAATSPSSTQSGFEARVAAFRAYDDTQRAWANITSARALLVEGE